MFNVAFLVLFAAILPAADPFVGLDPAGVDPRMGSWKLVSAQSSLNPPDKLSVTDVNGAVHVVMSGETHLDFTVNASGHETPVQGNPGFDQVVLRRMGKKQAEVTEKKAGAIVATIREHISKDENELTVTTARNGLDSQITVWTRSGGGKKADDPVAGDWVEDLNKTRLQQVPTLTIELDGTNGVHFVGDHSYTARFDGRPYDVKNSRNDTVTLQLADPHTVDATYRRDNQVTQHDKWAVAADGQSMTLTSTATLETGQHLAETLVFKKQ